MKQVIKKISFFILSGLMVISTFSCQSPKESIFEGSGDIGNCKFPGSVVFDAQSGQYTMEAAGLNLWANSDAFYMAWKKVSGDFSMSANIAFEGEGVNAHRKMGIMIRESLDAGSKYADIAIHGDGLTSLQYRAETDSITAEIVSANKAPDQIYLERKGNIVSIKTGKGSLPEQADGQLEITLPEECYVGLFMCSHEDSIVEKGYFNNVVFKKL